MSVRYAADRQAALMTEIGWKADISEPLKR